MKTRLAVCFAALTAILLLLASAIPSSASSELNPLTYSEGAVDSSFMGFNIVNSEETTKVNGIDAKLAISDFSVQKDGKDVKLFDAIGVENFDANVEPEIRGNTLEMDGGESSIVFHNNPTAAVTLDAKEENRVTFMLSGDTEAIEAGNAVILRNGDAKGNIFVHGDGEIVREGETINFELGKDSKLSVRMLPGESEGVTGSWNQWEIAEGIAEGSIVGEMYLESSGTEIVEDVVSYQSLQMKAKDFGKEKVDIAVLGEFTEGKIVVFNVKRNVISAETPDDLILRIDGKEIKQAGSLFEVLGENSEAKYYPTFGAKGAQVVVYIPHFSEHTISIAKHIPANALSTESIAMIAISAVVIVGASVAMFRRNKEE